MADQSQQQQQMPPYPPQYYPQRKKTRWWIPVVIIGVILLIFVGFIAAIMGTISSTFSFDKKKKVDVKANSVLYLDFGTVDEYCAESPFASFGGDGCSSSYFDILRAIKNAKSDDKIKGIYYKAGITNMGWAKAVELQDALVDFKTSGKFIYSFIEAGRESEYFNALPSDSIFMPAEGLLEMNGFGASGLFMKGFFDKIGVDYYVLGFEDFKSAGEMIGRKNWSDSARLQLSVILDQRYKNFTESVLKHRKISKEVLDAALNRGVYTADTLMALGFIDAYKTETQVREFLKDKLNKDEKEDAKKKLRLISVGSYMSSEGAKKGKVAPEDKQIAIIYGVGAIQDQGSDSPFANEKIITPATFIKNLKKAREDKDVKAIILRVDSPGGSVIASDAIQEEILATKKVKPVYASMSDVAASGGYYISMSCDTIIAHPATITGSIGVILAIPNLSGLMGKLDMSTDTISTGPAAQFMNGMYPFTDRDKQVLYDLGKGVYFRFVDKVAKNRKKSFEETRQLAKGRVWTGEDAYKHGLVDVLGGLDESIKIAKRRIGVPEDQKVMLQIYPRPEDPIEQLLKMFGLGDKDQDEDEVETKIKVANLLNIKPEMLINSFDAMPESTKNQISYMMQLIKMSKTEKSLMALPYYLDIH